MDFLLSHSTQCVKVFLIPEWFKHVPTYREVCSIPCSIVSGIKEHHIKLNSVYVAVNFFLQLNFILPLFLGMVMYDNEFKTKEK